MSAQLGSATCTSHHSKMRRVVYPAPKERSEFSLGHPPKIGLERHHSTPALHGASGRCDIALSENCLALLVRSSTIQRLSAVRHGTAQGALQEGESMSTATVSVRRTRFNGKAAFFVVFGLLTVFVVYMKNAHVFDPSSKIAQHFAPVKWYLVPHAFFGALAMLVGAFQFSSRLRARYLKVHRTLGYVYITGAFISGPLGVLIAKRIGSLLLAGASAVQAFGWTLTAAMALYCIRHGNIAQHRRWMIRSYPFAMAFTVARVIIPIPPVFKLGLPGIELVVWSTIALAAFLPNVFLDWRAMTARPASRAAAAD